MTSALAEDEPECRLDMWVRAKSPGHAFAIWRNQFTSEIETGDDEYVPNLDEAEPMGLRVLPRQDLPTRGLLNGLGRL